MRIRKAVFTWKRNMVDPIDYNNVNRIDVVFQEGLERPVLYIDAGSVKIEDGNLPIDVKEVLTKMGQVDFEQKYIFGVDDEFTGDAWELIINDKLYKGVLSEPKYVTKVRRIIRFNAIELYVQKKMSAYVKA